MIKQIKKLVINKSSSILTFPKLDLSFEPNEIKEVDDELFILLTSNYWIREVVPRIETTESKIKGRKKDIKIKKK